jgi:C4-dicarboxylate-specific signal transduction histidine kinase
LTATHNRLANEIAERLEAEQEARRRHDELAHATRVAMMGELSAEIAHEVSQPLTAIFNYTQGCLKRIESGLWRQDELEVALNAVLTQASMATNIVRRVRDYLQKSEPRQQAASVQAILMESISLLEHEANRLGIHVTIDCPPEVPQVWVDVIQIQQVVMNLLRNAFEAAAAANRDQRTVSIHVEEPDDGFVEIQVEDNGTGIPQSVIHHPFEAFVTSKPDGLGLGLSICRGIIVAHGGSIELMSFAEGARVRFTLPLARPDGEPAP